MPIRKFAQLTAQDKLPTTVLPTIPVEVLPATVTGLTDSAPTMGQKNALQGTQGTPGSLNKYVTAQDARLTDARTPTAHSHIENAAAVHTHSYAATAHTHAEADTTGLVADLAGKAAAAHAHAYATLTGVPSTFSPSAHSHVDADLPAGLARDAEVAAAYSPTNHTHPATGPTVVKLSTEQVSAVTTFADIPGFTRAIAANECVYFKAFLGYRANAVTTGIRLGVNGPASPTKLFYRTSTTRTNALQSAAGATDNEGTFNANTYDAPAADSGVAATGVDYIGTIEGVIFNGSTAGTLAMRFASEVAVANGITLARGSHVMFWTL